MPWSVTYRIPGSPPIRSPALASTNPAPCSACAGSGAVRRGSSAPYGERRRLLLSRQIDANERPRGCQGRRRTSCLGTYCTHAGNLPCLATSSYIMGLSDSCRQIQVALKRRSYARPSPHCCQSCEWWSWKGHHRQHTALQYTLVTVYGENLSCCDVGFPQFHAYSRRLENRFWNSVVHDAPTIVVVYLSV